MDLINAKLCKDMVSYAKLCKDILLRCFADTENRKLNELKLVHSY